MAAGRGIRDGATHGHPELFTRPVPSFGAGSEVAEDFGDYEYSRQRYVPVAIGTRTASRRSSQIPTV